MKLRKLHASLPDGTPVEAPGRYLIMRQHDIDCAAGKRGVFMAKAKQKQRARLEKIWNWMREGNEVRRFTREIQLEQRETRRLNQICREDFATQ